MSEEMSTTQDRLIEKSLEAFLMAIEIYNKPTIKYRVEGFAFFVCNAWELMLKAHLIKRDGEQSVYYKDQPRRTITLENCLDRIFTNTKDPLRMNLVKIIELRNTSTHFIVEEYEMVYVMLFQACILNYGYKMQEFHEVDIAKIVPQNFITLVTGITALNENAIRAKYPHEIAERIIDANASLTHIADESNDRFSIKIEYRHYITKNKSEADNLVYIDRNAATGVGIIRELKDPNDTHRYTMKKAIEVINSKLKSRGLVMKFNAHIFDCFNKVYGIKDNEEFCYIHKQYDKPYYSYSMKAVDFIVSEIEKDPENIVRRLKEILKK